MVLYKTPINMKSKLYRCPSFVPRRIADFACAAGDIAGVRRPAGEPFFVFNSGASSFGIRGVFGAGKFVVVFKRANSRLLRSLRTARGSEVRNCGWNNRRLGRMADILNWSGSIATQLIQNQGKTSSLENEARKGNALHCGTADFPVTAEAWRLCFVSTFGLFPSYSRLDMSI